MSNRHDPYDADRPLRLSCACGQAHESCTHTAAGLESDRIAPSVGVSARSAQGEATTTGRLETPEEHTRAFMEASLIKALFPQDALRRRFLKGVGRQTAMAAIASVVPLASLQAMAQERGKLEKTHLKIGFIPITCATPLIMAHPLGLYQAQGLTVELVKTAGWGLIRERMLKNEFDATHFLSPMPLAMSLGLGSAATPMNVATIQNINGQAIVLALKHKDNRDPKKWKGMSFGIPFEYSMHNFLLRYYLAEAGLNPDKDVKLKLVAPPQMVAELKAGNIDGFLGPDPFNQRAVYDDVGFIHLMSKQIWDGHPCCAFGTSEHFIQQNLNTFAALYRAIINSSLIASMPTDRAKIAKVLAPAQYLNQPEEVLNDVLVGRFSDGLGNVRNMPDRSLFDPVPWQSMAVWMLTQMKRWGYLKGAVNYRQIAEQVFLLTDAKKQMSSAGWRPPEGAYRKFKVMGREFDPESPEAYVDSFAINRVG